MWRLYIFITKFGPSAPKRGFLAPKLALEGTHSEHEDAKEIVDFSGHAGHDPFFSIFYHDHESIIVDLLKPPVYDDIPNDEVETPKNVEALQPKLMVSSSLSWG